MLAAIRAPSAATSTDGPAAPSAVRVASVTAPPYVARHLLGRVRTRGRAVRCVDALTCAGSGGEARSRHGIEWCPVGAGGLLCRPVGSQGPSGVAVSHWEDRCRG